MTDQTGPERPGSAERCTCGHTKRDHSGRRDHREKYGPIVAGRPWCHVCEAECIYCPPDPTEQQETEPAGYCPACGRGDVAPTADEYEQQRQRAETAEAVLARVRALHQPQPDGTGFPDGQQCATCSQDGGDGYQYLVPWPCPTARALGEPASAATQATDDPKVLGVVPMSDGIADMYGGWPREHCGHLMPAWVIGPRSECVLLPGHQGSHADNRGARWWYDPLSSGHS